LGPVSMRESRAHLSGISRVIVAVRDLDDAIVVYRDRLGIRTRLQGASAGGVRAAVCEPSSGGQIELRSPIENGGSSGRALEVFLRERGEGMHVLVLESADLDATARALRAEGIDAHRSATDPAQWEVDAASVHGVRIRIEPCSAAV
jgi:catechol 2,3-dioxygenase-like lactoylglutathione lyase family enzyme